MKHVAWDYENSVQGYYHIYPVTDEGDDMLDGNVELALPETDKNSADVQLIVDALDRIAERLKNE